MLRMARALVVSCLLALAAERCTGALDLNIEADGGSHPAGGPGGSATPVEYEWHDYVVIGAGAGGLQAAHYLKQAGRDFVVLDARPSAGGAFDKLPVLRKLISINKVHTGRPEDREFALRHDWNSLLDETDTVPRFAGAYSDEYYPDADDLLRYLRDFARLRGLDEHARYGTRVSAVRREAPEVDGAASGGPFVLYTTRAASNAAVAATDGAGTGNATGAVDLAYRCRYLIVATGLSKPSKNFVRNAHLATRYEDAPRDPNAYKGQRVLVLGRGNGAMEVASAAMQKAAYVHAIGDTDRRIRLAWETHYVGDIRAVHNALLESYQLKSQDGIAEVPLAKMALELERNPKPKGRRNPGEGPRIFRIDWDKDTHVPENNPLRAPYDRVIDCLGWRFDDSMFTTRPPAGAEGGSGSDLPRDFALPLALTESGKYPRMDPHFQAPGVPGLFFAGTLMHALDYRRTAGGFVHGFRYLVRAQHRLMESLHHAQPWPSVEVPLRPPPPAAAAAADGSSTDAAEDGDPADLHAQPGVEDALLNLTLGRINSASAPYQMFGRIVDVIVLGTTRPRAGSRTHAPPAQEQRQLWARYAEEVHAEALAHATGAEIAGILGVATHCGKRPTEKNKDRWLPVITVGLEFGRNASRPGTDPFRLDRAESVLERAHESNFLHPILRAYRVPCHAALASQAPAAKQTAQQVARRVATGAARDPKEGHEVMPDWVAEHHVIEDFLTDWTAPKVHVAPLRRWLREQVLEAAGGLGLSHVGGTKVPAASDLRGGAAGKKDGGGGAGGLKTLSDQKAAMRGVDPTCVWFHNASDGTVTMFDFSPAHDDTVALPGMFSVRHVAGVVRFGLCGDAAAMPCGDQTMAAAVLWMNSGSAEALGSDERCKRLSAKRKLPMPQPGQSEVDAILQSRERYPADISLLHPTNPAVGLQFRFRPGMQCQGAGSRRTQLVVNLRCDKAAGRPGGELPASSMVDSGSPCRAVIDIKSAAGCPVPPPSDRV